MPQPISTPTAAGMIAPLVGITEPTVAPRPKCTSGMAATWLCTKGRPATLRNCSMAASSTGTPRVQALITPERVSIASNCTDMVRPSRSTCGTFLFSRCDVSGPGIGRMRVGGTHPPGAGFRPAAGGESRGRNKKTLREQRSGGRVTGTVGGQSTR